MLYALWSIAGLLAAILLLLLVMVKDYAPALSEIHSEIRILQQDIRRGGGGVTDWDLSKRTDEITSELRALTRDLGHQHSELVALIKDFHAGVDEYLKWIGNKTNDIENHTAMIELNTDRPVAAEILPPGL
jgi:hypothetical protein